LNDGHYLIDDRTKNGVDQFKGFPIYFGTQDFTDWITVVQYFIIMKIAYNISETIKMWIEIKTDDFINALKGLKPKTNSPNKLMNLEAQISFENSEALIVINGSLTKCPAKGEWQGFVCLKFGYLVSFIKIKPISEIIKIEFEGEKLKIDSAKFSATWIKSSQWVTTQLADAQLFNLIAD
jgi:hypothetical protein